jgi:hypothetical protein
MSDPARVRFRQPVSTDGYVDAGWWPRSRDLTQELPPLLDVLWTAGREITRVAYNSQSWDPAPRKMIVQGRLVHLGGFFHHDPLVLSAMNTGGADRIEFLVIAPDSDAELAERALQLAGEIGHLQSPSELLALAAQ